MARKNKAAAPPLPKAQIEEPQKPKVTAKLDSSSEEEEEEEEEVEGVEEESEEEEESEDDGEEEEESESETDEEEEEESESESEEEEESKRETLRKLLEPFGKDQILDFLKEAALKDPSIIARITQSADCDPVHRKIFIHGLGWDATSDQVLSVFKPYGEIEECKVVTDKVTGRAKGYGFVLFKTRNGAKKALKQPQKKVGNRMSSCQLAAAGPPSATVNNHQSFPDTTGRKIFVANVSPHLNPDKLRAFFAKFGEIEEGPLGHDRVTRKLKGFALFVYKTAEGCRKALEEPVKVFDGCQLQCRLANKNQTGVLGASGAGGAIQQSDIRTMNYSVGVNPGMLGNNMNPAAVLMGQNPMLASAFGQSAMPPSAATGFSSSIGANPSFGFGGSYGINSISPSMIGSYGSPAALQGPQGLSAYQSAQLGKSSAGATSVAATRPQSGIGSAGTAFPSYYGR